MSALAPPFGGTEYDTAMLGTLPTTLNESAGAWPPVKIETMPVTAVEVGGRYWSATVTEVAGSDGREGIVIADVPLTVTPVICVELVMETKPVAT